MSFCGREHPSFRFVLTEGIGKTKGSEGHCVSGMMFLKCQANECVCAESFQCSGSALIYSVQLHRGFLLWPAPFESNGLVLETGTL